MPEEMRESEVVDQDVAADVDEDTPSPEEIEDLLGDEGPGDEPAPEAGTDDRPEDDQADDTAPADSQEETKTEAQTAPVEEKITIRGKTYTLEELKEEVAKDPNFLLSLGKTYEQFPHLQQRYQEMLQQQQAIQQAVAAQQLAQQAQMQGGGESQKGLPPAQDPILGTVRSILFPDVPVEQLDRVLKDTYLPAVQKQFGIEDDEIEYAPGLARGLAYTMAMLETVGMHLGGLIAERQQAVQQQVYGNIQQRVVGAFEQAASSGELYEPLKDPDERLKVLQYLAERFDPPIDAITPELIRDAWVAMHREEYERIQREALAQAQQQGAAMRARARSTSTGGSSSGGAPVNEFMELLMD